MTQPKIAQHKFAPHNWLRAACLCLLLTLPGSVAHPAPQSEQKIPDYSQGEFDAFQAVQKENNAPAKLKLLDAFAAQYPNSTLMPEVYRDYTHIYFAMRDYVHAAAYADKLLALGDKISLENRLEAAVTRAQSFSAGCSNSALQTPEAYAKAKDAAAQGQQTLDQWKKPPGMADTQFNNQKALLGKLFSNVTAIADSGLKGEKSASCKAP